MDEEDFARFHRDYQSTAYAALEGDSAMSQGELKAKWKTRMLSVHPDKPGGNAIEARKVNAAWDILKKPETRAAYDAFLEDGFPQPQTGPSEEISPVELLEDLGFDDVKAEDVDELMAKIAEITKGSTWSYLGYWFRRTVPITDTMHPVGFLGYFMSSDLAQATAVVVIIAYYDPKWHHLAPILGGQVLLTAGIALYILWEQVYKNSETWNVRYVLRTRARYWLIRFIFAVIFLLVAGMRARHCSSLANRCEEQRTTGTVLWLISAYQLFLAMSQWLTHVRAIGDGWVCTAVGGPGDYVEERRTNLLLYYDSWLNSLMVCLATGAVGIFTMSIVGTVLFFDLMITFVNICTCQRDPLTDKFCVCRAACLLATVLDWTSWAAYSFSNWRLRVMQAAWEEGDGRSCETELKEWELSNFKRALSKAVQSWKRKQAKRDTGCPRATDPTVFGKEQEEGDEQGDSSTVESAEPELPGVPV